MLGFLASTQPTRKGDRTSYPSLSATDIANAWVYAKAFSDEIETEIRENDEVMGEDL